jgi:hypothetical protein
VSQVFLAQLYGKGLLYHDQAHSPEAETERKKGQFMVIRPVMITAPSLVV